MKAEGAVTTFTIEVDVLVIKRALFLAFAHFIAQGTASVLDSMNEVMLKEEREGSKYCAALGCLHSVLEFAQGQRAMSLFQFLINKQSHGCKLNATMLETLFCFCHNQYLNELPPENSRRREVGGT